MTANTDESELFSGLAALHWSAYDSDRDFAFYQRVIAESGEPVLDVGCGTGRLLRRFLHAGIDAEGVDISAEMLGVCHDLCAAEGVVPTLHCQPMQHLDLPRRYQTILIPCGSLQAVQDRQNVIEALRRLRDHLLPGGALAFNVYLCTYDYSAPFNRADLPRAWQHLTEKQFPKRAQRLLVERRTVDLDPVEQYVWEERRYTLFKNDQQITQEVRSGGFHWFFKQEMVLMLQQAGFGDVQVTGDYGTEPFGPEHDSTMMFMVRQ